MMDGLQFRKAVGELRAIWASGNVYLDRTAPWKRLKEDKPAAGGVLAVSVNLIRLFSVAALPFIPATAQRVLRMLGTHSAGIRWVEGGARAELRSAAPGSTVGDPGLLFKKIAP